MYEIRPESLKSFIEDTNIKLPRFQRKQTWDDKKNFQLCISIFKEYPLGVSILNVEDNGGLKTRWLLDGRQRRNALTKFYRDPENVYLWAKKFIGLKATDQLLDIDEKFWKKINEYLEEDELNEEVDENSNSEYIGVENLDQDELNETEQKYDKSKTGLELLLHIIKLTHNKSTKYSGFTRPFDFTKEIPNLPYSIVNENGKKVLSSLKLKSFISEYKNYCSNDSLDYTLEESFEQFMKYRFSFDDKTQRNIELKISQRWDNIFERIDILDKINNLYLNSKIGLIEVKNLKSVDAQKIFNIINSEGTKLSAVEILSAKPSWNVVIKNPNEPQINAIKDLYKTINVINEDIVKWDLPATLLNRIEYCNLFFKEFNENSKTDFSKSITLGFKILAGKYQNGVTKDDIDKLGRNKNIHWESEFEEFVGDLNTVSKLILSSDYFKYLKSWKFSIITQLSDAISINFILLTYKDWVRKGKPIGNDLRVKQLQKNAFSILDNSIYEYVTKIWRGSSDSKISRNLAEFNNQHDIIKPISDNKWNSLLNEILEDSTIDGNPINQGLVQPILYHFYAISKIQGPDTNYKIEVDHIIPQSLFKASTIENKEVIVHNIFNLALLPKDENVSKSNKKLTEITNEWLIDEIKKYEFIDLSDFRKYSDLNNLNELKELRGEIILNAFKDKRNNILNN
ncbi:DUF262 domain-containing protein [Polaribacter dokdonensis]|uniref:DUF262 domain-containing protein n=1 Tax=Polaribacter dokdonensis DSW-5 TaxID=1300348 RepID=A0A0N0CFU2_9FLAO|nr:DUF262 domain-containing protein [Polaribacter dokdonensis]KOY52404.1 hypothetical protein I602_1964 [Polaribacter dokdonensis DSW-5]SEE44886.1 Protein of unknown function [Polaribacter dokdonensis DSW-5]